jgi:glutamate-1-semialdehyde 2,1-aminomutase
MENALNMATPDILESLQGEAADATEKIAAEIRALTPKTLEIFEHARRVVPDGFTRARFFWPTPIYMDHGVGSHIFDVDGREYVDCLMGFGAMLLGHCHPSVQDALRKQIERGWHYGTAVREESEVAEIIVEHVPAAEKVMFLNSGTEATLGAVRLAVAATGRRKVAKFEGGWHGWHDWLLHSSHAARGPAESPETVIETLGIPESIRPDLLTLPYNDSAAITLIREHKDELACVVMEGVLGSAGAIPAEAQWARELRAACDECGVVLILDEVITGFRLGASGAAGMLGIHGDLTTLGKSIGGGLPIGAICGPAELMDYTIPNEQNKRVLLAGTFSANPLTLAAGKAQLEVLLSGDVYDQFEELGTTLRQGITQALTETGVRGTVTGAGPLWGLHLETDTPPTSVRGSAGFINTAAYPLTGYLLREGVLMQAPVHQGFLGTAHTHADIEAVIAAHVRSFAAMKADGVVAGAPSDRSPDNVEAV